MSMSASWAEARSRSASDDPVRDAVAINLRAARLSQGLSLRELAARTHSSKALLSQIENSQANPTIDVLARIASALNLSVTDLIRTPLLAPEVIRRDERVENVGNDVLVRTLFSPSDRRRFELSEGRLPARSTSSQNAHHRGSVEYAFVTDGSVRVESQEWSLRLDRGDCIRFSAEFGHSYVTGSRPASVLTILTFADD
jgi:transcriptional regulator with XRE-family HTH domain